eukprot:TRINITY_DN2275_c0_g3_i1.p1 TRINITY_DN2275_c0_g3~~TRINITY_DN2275_c0_g3_i1.p1  ORF type:complete len:488 (-),score=149.47 TRINITY_DN2275_c0_g3_i1:180-1643(-)
MSSTVEPNPEDQVLLVSADQQYTEIVPLEMAIMSSVIHSMLAGTQVKGSDRFFFREAIERKVYFPSIPGDILSQVVEYMRVVHAKTETSKKRKMQLLHLRDQIVGLEEEERRLLRTAQLDARDKVLIKIEQHQAELAKLDVQNLDVQETFEPQPETAVELMMSAAYLELHELVEICVQCICTYFEGLPGFGDIPAELILKIVENLDNVEQLCRAEHLIRSEGKKLSCSAGWRRLYSKHNVDAWVEASLGRQAEFDRRSEGDWAPERRIVSSKLLAKPFKSPLKKNINTESDREVRLLCLQHYFMESVNKWKPQDVVEQQEEESEYHEFRLELGRTAKMLGPVVRHFKLSEEHEGLLVEDLFLVASYMQRIEYLDVSGCNLSPEHGEAIAAGLVACGLLTQINRVDLSNTGITLEGVETLANAMDNSYGILAAYHRKLNSKRRERAMIHRLNSTLDDVFVRRGKERMGEGMRDLLNLGISWIQCKRGV